MYRQVFITRACLRIIRAEVSKAKRTETGGALIGYTTIDKALVVTGASGPGPRAKLHRTSVLIDGKFADEFCKLAFKQTQGRCDYVGDWHRHTGWSLEASADDVAAMQTMAEWISTPVAQPISVIYRAWPPKIQTYLFNNRKLVPINHSILSE